MSAPERETSIFALREVTRVRQIDYEIESALYHNTPQALLRDLHRPTKTFGVNPLELDKHERVIDGGRGFVAEVKQTIYTSYKVPIVDIMRTHRELVETIGERRQLMSSPWADAPKFGSQYLPTGMSWSG